VSANPSARAVTRCKPSWARGRPNAKPKARDLNPLRRLKQHLQGLPLEELLAEADEEACCILVRPAEGTPVPAAEYDWAKNWLGLTDEARRAECAA